MTLKEKRAKLHADATAIFAKAKAEARELTADEIVEKDKLFSAIKAIDATMESERELAGLAFSEGAPAVVAGAGAGKSKAEIEAEAASEGSTETYEKASDRVNMFLSEGDTAALSVVKEKGKREFATVMPKQFQRGRRNNFVITTAVDSSGLIPKTVGAPTIVRRMYNAFLAAIIGMGYAPIMTATAENFTIPVVDDTSVTGDTPAENASADAATDPTITDLTLGATLFSSQTIWLSNTMIATIGYDLVSYLMPLLDKRVELKQDAAWITKLLAVAAAGNTVTVASATGFTYDELVSVYHKLGIPYRQDAVWIVSDTFLQAVRLLKDSEGRPLFNMLDPLVNAGAIGKLMGAPVYESLNMPTLAANHIPAAFVSAECLKARFVTNRRIARYTNIPTFPDQVGFRLFENADAAVNSAGVAFMKTAIS